MQNARYSVSPYIASFQIIDYTKFKAYIFNLTSYHRLKNHSFRVRKTFKHITKESVEFIIIIIAIIIIIIIIIIINYMAYETQGSMPHSQGLTNNPYPEPNQPNFSYLYLFL